MMNAKVARDAAPNTAPMATRANAPEDRFAEGKSRFMMLAKAPPSAALDMKVGASSPPDVPDPSEMTMAADLAIMNNSNNFNVRFAFKMSLIVSYPTPRTRGTK